MPRGHVQGEEKLSSSAFPESPASSDLEDCAGRTTASRVEGVNLEDCTKPLKQTSAGAVWSGRGFTRSRSGPGLGKRKQASAGCGLERSDSSDTVGQSALCVGLQRLQRRESRSQCVFPVGWQERELGTHPTRHQALDGKVRTECVLKLSLREERGPGGKLPRV